MPPETFHGPDIPSLFARARAVLGDDAVVTSVGRAAAGAPGRYRLVAMRAAAAAPARAPKRVSDARVRALLGGMAWPALHDARRDDGLPPVLALVGPTGAGKTTTIAKLVNHPDVFGDRRVGLLCLDTYRIGAVEQLRIYAELSGVPFQVAHETSDVRRAWKRLAGCDVVVADTAGRGPRRDDDVAVMRAQLAELAPVETHLVRPAGMRDTHARELLRRHQVYGVTHLLATKLDECPGDCTVLDLALAAGMPMRWCTDGQEVPGDLRAASVLAAALAPAPVAEEVGA